MDWFITITDKKVVKFVVNTGTGKITDKDKVEKTNLCGKFSLVYYLQFEWDFDHYK